MTFSPYAPPQSEPRITWNPAWLLTYTSLTLLIASASPISRWIDPDCEWNVCLATVFLVTFFGRMAGWSADWPAGLVGRHAVAFFVGAICGSATLVWLQYFHHEGDFQRDFRDGIAAGSILYGIGFALLAEILASIAMAFYQTVRSGKRS